MSARSQGCRRFLAVCGPRSNYQAFAKLEVPKLLTEFEELEKKYEKARETIMNGLKGACLNCGVETILTVSDES